MKKIFLMACSMVFFACVLSACDSEKRETSATPSAQAKIKVVATIFPEYDWVRAIAGATENVEVTLLMDKGTDLHSYNPSADDMVKIAASDLFIYVGGESDEWVEKALENSANQKRKVINLVESLGSMVKEEVLVEGMEADEHEHHGDHDDDHDGDHHAEHHDGDHHAEHHDGDHDGDHHEEGPEYDEHVWLSLRNTVVLIQAIEKQLSEIDPAHANTYKANAEAYIQKLTALDGEFKKVVDGASVKTLLFGDRFPFRYFADDYGLSYFAAFAGCSAESEASFETVVFLAKKVDSLGLKNVMTLEKSDGKIASTIVQNSKAKDQKILALNSMQSVTAKDVADGVTYLSLMESNLAVLKEALK